MLSRFSALSRLSRPASAVLTANAKRDLNLLEYQAKGLLQDHEVSETHH